MNVPPDFPFNLNLPAKDVDLLLQLASSQPYNVVAGLVTAITQQITSQIAVHEAAVKETQQS